MSDEQPKKSTPTKTQLYLNTKTADVHFLFDTVDGTAVEVAAHKNLLAVASDVFETMFYGEMKETGNVHLRDASEAAFLEFLQYFYLNEVKLSTEHIEEVLYLGEKYNVKKCINDCQQFLIKWVDDENVCSRLHLAILHEKPELIRVCEKRILLNTVAIFNSAGFLACDRLVLKQILKMNKLSCSEVDVFDALMSWVIAKSKQNVLSKELVETHVGDLFYEVRFASMKIQDFCDLTDKYDAVLSSYHRAITKMIVNPHSHTNGKSSKFNTFPRHAKWNESANMKCDRMPSNKYITQLDPIEKIKFSTNEPLLLGRFTCDAIYVGDSLEDLRLELNIDELEREKECGNLIFEMKSGVHSVDTSIFLPHPILIRPGFFYTIEIGPFSQAYRFIRDKMKKQVELEPDIIIKFYDCRWDDDSCDEDDEDDEDDDEWVHAEFITQLDFNPI